MSTINHPYSFIFQSSPLGQFNLNSNHSNLNTDQNTDRIANLNNSNSNFDNPDNSSNNLNNNLDNLDNNSNILNLNTNSNLNQTIRNELSSANLSNRTNFGRKANRKNPISIDKFLNQRSYGNRTPCLSSDYGLNHLISNNLFKEDQINLGQVDKVYSSCWLDDDVVICGTKCNKLIVINLNNKKQHHLPVAHSESVSIIESESIIESKSIIEREPIKPSSGIYSITINPSRNLLATSTKEGNDIVIYSLPSLEILSILVRGHEEAIFDIVWLDDHYLASGSKDSKIVIWRIDHDCEIDAETNLYKIKIVDPVEKFNYEEIEQIRCLNFNRKNNELCVLSIESDLKLHIVDAITMDKKLSTDLVYYTDLCCLAQNEDNLYAVGSKSHIQLIDSRTLTSVSTLSSKLSECAIRSLSFNSEILTIGAGGGNVLFYDIRNSKYFCNKYNQDLITLKTSKGWIKSTSQMYQNYGNFTQLDLPAIYTHQFDKNKTRLFTAGGPIGGSMVGNYCGIWS